MIAEVARALRDEAAGANERRLLVLAGDRDCGIDAAYDAVSYTNLRAHETEAGIVCRLLPEKRHNNT